MATESVEDYLKCIHSLIETKGYARSIEIAAKLKVLPSTVSRMIQKLDEQGFVVYQKYRGFILTDKGKEIAHGMKIKHRTIEEFLGLIGAYEVNIINEAEGMEHHISEQTLECISTLLSFFQDHPDILKTYKLYCSRNVELS